MITAIENGDVDAVRHFLKKGLSANETIGEFERKRNMISLALGHRHLEVADVLYKSGATLDGDYGWNAGTLLHLVAEMGYADGVKFVLDKCPDLLNQKTPRGSTALHLAAHRGNADCVKLLLDFNADVSIKDGDNRTAYYRAEAMRRKDILDLFDTHAHQKRMEQEPVTTWRKLDDYRIACITHEKRAGYTITDIFNFKARERTKICQNMETKQESSQTIYFDDMRDKRLLHEALAELITREGRATEDDLRGIVKPVALSPKSNKEDKKDLKP